MLCLKLEIQKASIYYTFNKSHLNSLFLLVFPHVANFIHVANIRFLTLPFKNMIKSSKIVPILPQGRSEGLGNHENHN